MAKPYKYPKSPYGPESLQQLERRVHAIRGVLDKVVRVDWLIHRSRHNFARKYFYNWRRRYGINVPEYKFFDAGKVEGVVITHVVIERIYGIALDRSVKLPAESRAELDQLLVKLFQATFDAYRRQQDLCGDMGLKQFMYGHRHGERAKRFYLVDVDPWFTSYSPKESKRYDHCFALDVNYYFPSDIRRAERWLGEKMIHAREKLKELRDFAKQNAIKQIEGL